MKWRTLILSLVAFSFIATLFIGAVDEPAPKSFGQHQFGSTTLEALTAAGLVKLSGTSIQNTLHVDGSLIAKDATIGTLEVTGEANLTRTTLHNPTRIFGSLQANHSTFEQLLTIQTQKAVFTATSLNAITVQKDVAFKGKQILELRQGTQVNGPILFESGKGEVLVYPGSLLLGSVTGGKVIKKS